MAMRDDAALDLILRKAILCNGGRGDPAKVLPTLPRLDLDDACTLL